MKLQVDFKVKSPVSAAWLKRLSSLVLRGVKGASFEKRSELSIVLAGDAEVKKLNRVYRKKNKTTDVLSFPLLEGKKMILSPKEAIALGDVVISLPQAKRQAAQQGKKLKGELALLLVHGILHLLGYDHVSLIQERKMFNLQNSFLRKFRA